MSNLTPVKIATFIDMMSGSTEAENDGFEILAKRSDAGEFFDELVRKGVLIPDHNPKPVPVAGREGYLHVPHWSGLDYLNTIARSSVLDRQLTDKLVNLMSDFTQAARDDATRRDNYHTWNAFAEIAAEIPAEALSDRLIALIPIWLSSQYDKGLVGGTLGTRLIPKLIQSGQPTDIARALRVLGHVMEIRWIDSKAGTKAAEPEGVVDDYWVAETLKRNLEPIARKAPKETVELLRSRVDAAFAQGTRQSASWVHRAAIEDHPQNQEWKDIEDILIEAWRDAISIWFEADTDAARDYVMSLFEGTAEIERRIAVHFIDKRFEVFAHHLPAIVSERLLSIGLLHESFLLLRNHFGEFGPEAQAKLLGVIDAIDASGDTEEKKMQAMRTRRSWLTAIVDLGSQEANTRYRQVVGAVGPPGAHPEFLSYMESSWGPGPSPYSVAEIVNYLMDGSLIPKLNEFQSEHRWDGPNREALCSALTSAVQESPTEFLGHSAEFLTAQPAYQYAYLSGYEKLWGAIGSAPSDQLDWSIAWPKLLEWMLALVRNTKFSPDEKADDNELLTPRLSWIPGLIASLIRAGVRNDEKAFDPGLLPIAKTIIDLLLQGIDPDYAFDGRDAVGHAINSQRGKVVEALFSVSLRWARLEDRAKRSRATIWQSHLQPLFDRELDKVKKGNPEFVTLFAQFTPQIQYLSENWTTNNISKIFGEGGQLAAALAGLAYAQATTALYKLLQNSGILDKALAAHELDREVRARLLERVALACLWGEEQFGGNRIGQLFESRAIDDLAAICSFLAGLSIKDLKPDQVEKVLSFWRRTTKWALPMRPAPQRLLSTLARFPRYLSNISEEDEPLVIGLAEYANANSNGWYYVTELARLVQKSPERVAKALLKFVESPGYLIDAHGELLRATEHIYKSGNKAAGDALANAMRRSVPFRELYNKYNS